MPTIRKFKITLEPIVVEFEGDMMRKGAFDALSKRISDLAVGDQVRAQGRVAAILELPGVPTQEAWSPDIPPLPPR